MIAVVGQVLLDNVDGKTLQLKRLRDQIGLVNHEPALLQLQFLRIFFMANLMRQR
jgi:ABC-type multidrug transport system fused ATPase/permease subunit